MSTKVGGVSFFFFVFPVLATFNMMNILPGGFARGKNKIGKESIQRQEEENVTKINK